MKSDINTGEKKQKLSTDKIYSSISIDLRKFIYSKIADEDIVNDLVQDIFCKIHSNIHQLQDSSKLGSWVFQIARNAIMDYFRNKKKAQEFLNNIDKEDYSINDASTEILQFCMHNFISKLPEIYKNALVFTQIEGNSQTILAKKEGISVSTAKSRVQRARKQLKNMIINYCQFESNSENIDFLNIKDYCPLSEKL